MTAIIKILEPLQQFACAWLPVMLDAAIKGMLLLAAAGMLSVMMRKASAAARQVVWTLALVAMLALPLASVILPGWQVLPGWAKIEVPADTTPAVSAGEGESLAEAAPAEMNSAIVPQPKLPRDLASASHSPAAISDSTQPVAAVGPEPEHTQREVTGSVTSSAIRNTEAAQGFQWAMLASAIAGLWLAGTLVCLLPLVLGRLSLRRIATRSRRIEDGSWGVLVRRASEALGLRREVILLQSAAEPMPMIWGVRKPKLLLPAEADNWTTDRRWAVLLHELAHANRHDCLAKLIAHIACAAYWFNPLCWIAFKLMQREAEIACDDMVLAAGERPSDYASHLLEIASGLESGMLASYSSIAMARKSKLEGRLLAILDAGRNRRALTRAGICVATVLIAAIAIPLACIQVAGVQAANAEPSTEGVAMEASAGAEDVSGNTSLEVAEQKAVARQITKSQVLDKRPSPPITLVSSKKTKDVSTYHWRISRDSACRLQFGWFSGSDKKIGKYVGEVTPKAQSGPIDLKLTIKKEKGFFRLIQEYSEGDGQPVRKETRIELPPQCVLRESHLSDRIVLTNVRNQVIWTGTGAIVHKKRNWIQQKSTVRFIVRVLKHNESADSFRPPFNPLHRRDSRFSVTGRITDSQGRGMYGVTVRASTGIGSLHLGGDTITGADGRYTLRFGPGMLFVRDPNAPMGVGFQFAAISARKPGFFEAKLCHAGNLAMAEERSIPAKGIGKHLAGVVLPDKPYKLDFVMLPAARIEGRLVDRKGNPIADDKIWLTGDELYPANSVLASIQTDKTGKFTVEDVPCRTFWFTHSYGKRDEIATEPIKISAPVDYMVRLVYDASTGGKPDFKCTPVRKADFAGWDKIKIAPTGPGVVRRKAMSATNEDRLAKRTELSGRPIEHAHDDGAVAGRNSIAGSGHGVRFKVSGDSWNLRSVRIHGSRYGYPRPPIEDFHVWLCDKDFKIIADFPFPYSKFVRGKSEWVTLKVPPTEVPQDFIICVGFDPTRTKGVYVSRDKEGSGNSLTGLPGRGARAFNRGDWLIRARVDQSTLKPITKAAGKLEFRVAPRASSLSKAELGSYRDWLKAGRVGLWWKGGRIRGRMPDHAWLPVSSTNAPAGSLVTGEYKGQKYVLVSDKPGETMLVGKGTSAWGLRRVYVVKDNNGRPAIGFSMDDRGTELLAAFTKANIGNALAIVIDGKVFSTPTVNTTIRGQGIITGDFSPKKAAELIKALKTGMPPTGPRAAWKLADLIDAFKTNTPPTGARASAKTLKRPTTRPTTQPTTQPEAADVSGF